MDAASNSKLPDDLLPASVIQLTVPMEYGRKYRHPCKQRIDVKTVDTHLLCVKCRGHDCNIELQYVECVTWLDEEMSTYVKHHSKLEDKLHTRVLCETVSGACEEGVCLYPTFLLWPVLPPLFLLMLNPL